MKKKRLAFVALAVACLLLGLFLPIFPWSARCRHSLKRLVTKAEIRWAKWHGHEPQLLSIAGALDRPGVEVQAIDSRSGWAALTDNEGRFRLPGVLWYPGASYDLVISDNEQTGGVVHIVASQTFPEGGVLDVGHLDLSQSHEANLESLPGINATTYEEFDEANRPYYQQLYDELVAGKSSDEEKISAINDHVATKLNYDETRWELGSPRRILEHGSQYCGHLSAAMATLLAIGHYRIRTVNVSDDETPPGTHVVVEVFYDGQWHLYDPTFGVVYRTKAGKVASYEEVHLDTSLIVADLFRRFPPDAQRQWAESMRRIYRTGFHHFYRFHIS
jgi:hypothetical protein